MNNELSNLPFPRLAFFSSFDLSSKYSYKSVTYPVYFLVRKLRGYLLSCYRLPKYERSYAATDIELLLLTIQFKITLPAFSDEELYRVICVLYERIAPYARKLLFMFRAVCTYGYCGRKLTSTYDSFQMNFQFEI